MGCLGGVFVSCRIYFVISVCKYSIAVKSVVVPHKRYMTSECDPINSAVPIVVAGVSRRAYEKMRSRNSVGNRRKGLMLSLYMFMNM